LAPAYAGIRGEGEAPLIYQADDIQVVVQAQEDAERPDRRAILGLVIGLTEGHELKAHLWRSGQRIVTVPVDELGNFVIPDLTPGGYELILSGPELEIHIQELQVGIK
jgi:hypothetical protein